ncbi:MAG: hypothetical protein WCD89_20005 [Anaerocolumna sp.]
MKTFARPNVLILYTDQQRLGDEILFDLDNNPEELNNVIDKKEYASDLSAMRKRMLILIQGGISKQGTDSRILGV